MPRAQLDDKPAARKKADRLPDKPKRRAWLEDDEDDAQWPSKAKLTDGFVRNLKNPPEGRTVFVSDTDLRGFKLRLTSTTKSYVVERRAGRGRGAAVRRVTIGRVGINSAADARREAVKALARLSSGEDITAERRKERAAQVRDATTLKQLLDRYLEVSNLKPATQTNYRFAMKHYEAWHDRPLAELTADVIKHEHQRISKASDSMGANSGRVLAALFSYAVEEGLVESNVAHEVLGGRRGKKGKRHTAIYKHRPRRRALKEEQLPSILRWLEQQSLRSEPHAQCCADFAELLLMYGLRKGEAACLTWDQIDLNAGYVSIEDTKSGKPLTLPITKHARELFERRRAVADEYGSEFVFPSLSKRRKAASGHLYNVAGFFSVLNEANGTKTTPHDFRKYFVSVGGKMMPGSIVRAIVNHAATRTGDIHVDHYEHVEPEDMREPLKKWHDHLAKTRAKGPKKRAQL